MNSQEKAYNHLKTEIISLSLRPGIPLRSEDIARKLRISRTPVREALSRLAQDGFVKRERGWGYVVYPLSHKDILDLFGVRESLEVQAAVEAQANLTTDDFAKLNKYIREAESLLKQGRFTDFRLLSREFHLLIAARSENELLFRLVSVIRDRVLLVGALHWDIRKSRAREVLLESKRILKALQSGNLREVRASVLAHIRNSKNSILRAANDR